MIANLPHVEVHPPLHPGDNDIIGVSRVLLEDGELEQACGKEGVRIMILMIITVVILICKQVATCRTAQHSTAPSA
jgi:hypothetical protein